MMTCWEHENVDIDDSRLDNDNIDPNQIENGIPGSCEYCDKKILQKHYAKRMPMVGGSWKGCFCKWQCVKDSTDDDITISLCNYFKRLYNRYGIFDRVWIENENLYIPLIDNNILNDMIAFTNNTSLSERPIVKTEFRNDGDSISFI